METLTLTPIRAENGGQKRGCVDAFEFLFYFISSFRTADHDIPPYTK